MSIPNTANSQKKFTARQGQFLAFIYYYTKVSGRSPAESDIQRYFGVSSASTHQMIKGLVEKNLLEKIPRQARSMRILIPKEQLPTDW